MNGDVLYLIERGARDDGITVGAGRCATYETARRRLLWSGRDAGEGETNFNVEFCGCICHCWCRLFSDGSK